MSPEYSPKALLKLSLVIYDPHLSPSSPRRLPDVPRVASIVSPKENCCHKAWTWIQSSPGSARVGRALRQLVKPAACARPDVTMQDPSAATVPYRELSASSPRPRLSQPSESSSMLNLSFVTRLFTPLLTTSRCRASFESSTSEILQQLGHITSLLEDIKQGGGSALSSNLSTRGSLFELTVQNSSPLTDPFPGHSNRGDTAAIEDRVGDHDPLALYAANSAEHMLRWPIYNKIITDAEKNIRSFLLDSMENQSEPPIPPPRALGVDSFLDDIQHLCRKYVQLVHRRNPIVDAEILERYAREVTIQGLGWDGPSCQVVSLSSISIYGLLVLAKRGR